MTTLSATRRESLFDRTMAVLETAALHPAGQAVSEPLLVGRQA